MKKIAFVLVFIGMASLTGSVCYAVCLTDSGGCHEVMPNPPSVLPERNCLAAGCHDTSDNRNHHTTGWAMAGMCSECHNPNLVADYDDENPVSRPVSTVTPTVESCNNCHKGHTNPVNENGEDYPFPIYNTAQLEHMAGMAEGTYVDYCTLCHGDVIPTDPYAIRYCETCHNTQTLHAIPGHAVTCDPPQFPCPDPLPYDGYWYDESEVWTLIAYGDYNNERCLGCHPPAPPEYPALKMSYVSQTMGAYDPAHAESGTYDTTYSELDEFQCRICHGQSTADRHHMIGGVGDCGAPPAAPVINTTDCGGMTPVVGVRMARITLTGTDFGSNGVLPVCGDYKVQMKEGVTWQDLPAITWIDNIEDVIESALPPNVFTPYANHEVRVETPTGQSNSRNFYVLPAPVVDRIEDNTGKDAQGPIGGWLKIYSTLGGSEGTFNDARKKWYEDPLGGTCPNYFGVIYVVTFTSSSGRLCATEHNKWNDSGNKDSFKVKLDNLWEDLDGDYYQDGGEPSGAPIYFGAHSVQVCLIIYGDSNGSGGYSGDDDDIYQVVKSKSDVIYDVSDDPWITELVPTSTPVSAPGSPQKVKIKGLNFGATQGTSELHIGGKTWSAGHSKIKLWNYDMIKFKVPKYQPPFPKNKEVWVTVNGKDSNKVSLEITGP